MCGEGSHYNPALVSVKATVKLDKCCCKPRATVSIRISRKGAKPQRKARSVSSFWSMPRHSGNLNGSRHQGSHHENHWLLSFAPLRRCVSLFLLFDGRVFIFSFTPHCDKLIAWLHPRRRKTRKTVKRFAETRGRFTSTRY